MSLNIFRVQFAHSIRTFGIRCLPSLQNKSTLLTTKPFIATNSKLITNLSNNNNANRTLFRRHYNTSTPLHKSNSNPRSLVEREKAKEWNKMTTGQKVVGAAKVTTNISIIAIGIGVFGIKELFSSSGSAKVLNETLEKIKSNSECQKILGPPIKGHGGSSGSGRRRNRLIRFQEVINTDGTEHKLMRIYLEGSITRGTALLDMIKNDKGVWVTKYLVVITDYGNRIFVEYHDDVNKET